MRKILIGALLLVLSSSTLFAQDTPCANVPAGRHAPGQPGGMMMNGDMMQMCEPMMRRMMEQAIITRDMMQLVKEVVQIEQRIVKGLNAAEREQVLAELDQKLKRIDQMMSEMRAVMMKAQPSPAPAPGQGGMQLPVPGHLH